MDFVVSPALLLNSSQVETLMFDASVLQAASQGLLTGSTYTVAFACASSSYANS